MARRAGDATAAFLKVYPEPDKAKSAD